MDKISPPFDFSGLSIDLEAIQVEAENIAVSLQKVECNDDNLFPLEVFPQSVQGIVRAANETLGFPIDFTGAAMLFAISLAIGNTHRAEVMNGWLESPLLYIAMVGRAGTNKTHPLKFALKPFFAKDEISYRNFEQKHQEYLSATSLTKKEREQQCIGEPVKPIWQKHIVQDFTSEALTEVHKFNKRGVGVYADELAGWIKNFNKYNKGSEQEFWLSNWSGTTVTIDRKGSEPTLIKSPFIPVIGTIQNAILDELGKDNKSQNGFKDRILFVMPSDLKKPYWSDREICPTVVENWHQIVTHLLDLPLEADENQNPSPNILRFEPEAYKVLKDWQKHNTDLCNSASDEAFAGIYSKLEVYAVRLSLVLQMMYWAAGEGDKKAISMKAVKGAIALTEYFRTTALKVHSLVTSQNPLDKLSTAKRKLYEALPDSFTTGEGRQIAEELDIPAITFKRFLNEKRLFEKVNRGEYEKKF